MPYKVFPEEDHFCVHKLNADDSMGKRVPGGCHPSQEEARRHMAALYIAEQKRNKELDDDELKELADEFSAEAHKKTLFYPATAYPMPISFAQLDEARVAMHNSFEVMSLSDDFQALVDNIMHSEDVPIDQKGKSVAELADEFSKRVSRVDTNADMMDEQKEVDGLQDQTAIKEVWSTSYVNSLPNSSFLYVEPGEDDGEGKRVPRTKRHFPYKDASGKVDLPHLRNAVGRIPQSNAPGLSPEKKRALQARAQRMLASAQKEKENDSLVERITAIFKGLFDKEKPVEDLMIFKEGEDYKWIGRYSNNFRDNDSPPEIISAQSHQRFVELVDKGLAPLPELQIWHVKDWTIGKSDWVLYDDAGFAFAGGKFDSRLNQDFITQLAKAKDIRLSHGMPNQTIKRDPDDPTIIVEHETREISILPSWAAANQITGFALLKEDSMSIPEEKRKNLQQEWGLSEATLATIERLNQSDADKATEAGIENKEVAEAIAEAIPEVEVPVTETPVVETPVVNEEVAPQTPTFSVEDVRALVETVATAINAVTTRLDTLEGEIKSLKEVQTTGDELMRNTPLASLVASFGARSAIGSPEAQVDGRSGLAKDKPKETPPQTEGRTLVPFIDQILAGSPAASD